MFRTLATLLPKSVLPGEQTFLSNVPSRPDTLVAASTTPIAVIPAGYSQVLLSTATAGGELAIFTRDGRQISGPAMAASIVRESNGFFAGATYSNDYLNRSGPAGYLDQNFIRGPYQESGSQIDASGQLILTPAKIFGSTVNLEGLAPGSSVDLRINGQTVTVNVPNPSTVAGLADAINVHRSATGAVAEATSDGKLVFTSYQQITVPAASVVAGSVVTIGGVSFTADNASALAIKINSAAAGISATVDAVSGNLVITNGPGRHGEPIVIGDNTLSIERKTHFNDASLSIDVEAPTASSVLKDLGLRTGFVMNGALAEDLLVFGVNGQGLATSVLLSGSYQEGLPSRNLAADAREYVLRFEAGRYTLTDKATDTEVAAGEFNTTTRTISYGNWTVTMSGIPADQDSFTILPTDEPLGDNRIASAIARLQFNRSMLASKQTVQQEYENLVNRVGALTVQAEIAKDAQQVVFDHARESRDRVSGVNLDEELADLLRFQQAYQANAQVIQVANRLFDSLLQRL